MKKILYTTLLSASSLLLTGCGNNVPKCSDKDTTDLVKQISNDEMVNQMGKDFAAKISYNVEAIRTTDENEKTGAFECAADLKITASNGISNKLPITYTVEGTDDGKQFYVNVFGLK